LPIETLQIIDCRAQSDPTRNMGRTRLKLIRQDVVVGFFEGYQADHITAALIGRHLFQELTTPVQHTHAGGPKHLMAGKRVKITAEILHINSQVRHRLCAIEENGNAAFMGESYNLLDRGNGPESIRDMG